MATATPPKPKPMSGLRRALGGRRGSLGVAIAAAALAAIALVSYLNQYEKDVRGGTAPVQVLVADRLIKQGTTGDAVVAERLFSPMTVPQADVKAGALVDASALAGKSVSRDLYPGQQLTAADLTAGGDTLRGRLSGRQRAVGVPVDAAHGLLGRVKPGDEVDVFASFPNAQGRGVVRVIARGVLVLGVPASTGGGGLSGGGAADPVVLRMNDDQAGQLAYAADNGKVWFAIRPPAGAQESDNDTITAEGAR